MLHISQKTVNAEAQVSIDGTLTGQDVAIADDCCRQIMQRGARLIVMLREVTSIDGAGIELLERLSLAGARLRANGAYAGYIVERIGRRVRRRATQASGH